MTSPTTREHPIDALDRSQRTWRAGLPYSRFGLPLIALGVLALVAALRVDLDRAQLALTVVFAVAALAGGLVLQAKARKVAQSRKAHRQGTPS